MPVVYKSIRIEEAHAKAWQKLDQLKELLKRIKEWLYNPPTVSSNEDSPVPDMLKSIFSSTLEVLDQLIDVTPYDVDTAHLREWADSMLEEFARMTSDERQHPHIHRVETDFLNARNYLWWIEEARRIIDDPVDGNKPRAESFMEFRELVGIAFHEMFTRFAGFRVDHRMRHPRYLEFHLKDGPEWDESGYARALDALAIELDEFLAWELRKFGLLVTYNIEKFYPAAEGKATMMWAALSL